MNSGISRSGPRAAIAAIRHAAPLLATAILVPLASGCIERRADPQGHDTVTLVDTVLRVDTVVKVDTLHVRDTLVGLGDGNGASAAATTAATPAADPAPAPTPPATGSANPPVTGADLRSLVQRKLLVPIAGIAAAKLPDTFDETRGTHPHEALDILAPRGTPVRSADDGTVLKLFNSKAGGITVYVRDTTSRFIYYYAHLDHYAPGLAVGQQVHKGDVLGFVGSTGDASANAPHLHFAIARNDDMSQWWKGTPINPTPVLQGRMVR
jgi:murein DD-endopeptidase MepM/ murein hydrolase activator NlpD